MSPIHYFKSWYVAHRELTTITNRIDDRDRRRGHAQGIRCAVTRNWVCAIGDRYDAWPSLQPARSDRAQISRRVKECQILTTYLDEIDTRQQIFDCAPPDLHVGLDSRAHIGVKRNKQVLPGLDETGKG